MGQCHAVPKWDKIVPWQKRGAVLAPHARPTDLAIFRLIPGDKPTGPPTVENGGFGIICFFPAKSQPGHSVLIFSTLGCCLGGLRVPGTPWGSCLCPSQALTHAEAGWHRAWHIRAEVGQPGKVTPSLFPRFPPHCHLQDTTPGIPGNPQPRARLGMVQISQGFWHFQSWQNYRYRKSRIQKPMLLPVREAYLHPVFKALAVGRAQPVQAGGCLCSSHCPEQLDPAWKTSKGAGLSPLLGTGLL